MSAIDRLDCTWKHLILMKIKSKLRTWVLWMVSPTPKPQKLGLQNSRTLKIETPNSRTRKAKILKTGTQKKLALQMVSILRWLRRVTFSINIVLLLQLIFFTSASFFLLPTFIFHFQLFYLLPTIFLLLTSYLLPTFFYI